MDFWQVAEPKKRKSFLEMSQWAMAWEFKILFFKTEVIKLKLIIFLKTACLMAYLSYKNVWRTEIDLETEKISNVATDYDHFLFTQIL